MTTASTIERSMGLPGRALLVVVLAVGLFLAQNDLFTVFFYVCYAAVGTLLVIRRPRNAIGWLLILIAYGFVGTTGGWDLDVAALQQGTASWAEFLIVWATAWAGYATFGFLVALMLLFPSGRMPIGRWRRPAKMLLAACVALTVLSQVAPTVSFNPNSGVTSVAIPNRFALLPELAAWSLVPLDSLIAPMVVFLAIGVVSMLVRYRRASGLERLQLRWLVAALAFVVLAVTAGLSSVVILGEDIGGLAWIPASMAFPTVPAAIYIAITRYRLYEIDRIISRTIGWVVVTAVLAGVFALAIVGLQAMLAPVTGNNTLAVAVSTLVAAALFQPLRGRVQQLVDRRFNRARVDAQHASEAFGAQVRENVDLTALRDRLLTAVDGSVQPSGAGIWIRGTER